MVNYFFVAVVITFCFQMYSYTSQLGKVRRVFDSLDYSVVQRCVYAVQNDDESGYGPYFVEDFLRNTLREYFSSNFDKAIMKIDYEFNVELTDPYIVNEQTVQFYKGTKITLRANYFQNYTYTNNKKFIIKEKT